ncbi:MULTISPECIES: hypothetical protein [Vibrio]|uniref:Uncharacterized protein n=1 Tax=Vibrio marisflavi CECT 7928 TaxID=634439 RepID=A0ABM9AB02_9VIBR|nr:MULTISPECIES: hypothetical protein [Vibrio]CAH0542933.1 hypothetical protein VMF7928_04311 [Vibrio marisflavi CECT 7928]
MSKSNKTMLMTVLATLLVIAVINNISTLQSLKEVISGDSGWF